MTTSGLLQVLSDIGLDGRSTSVPRFAVIRKLFRSSKYIMWASLFFFSSRRRHTRFDCDWSSDVCSSDLLTDDDKDIKSISEDGYLEITKVTFGSRRSIVITPSENGIKREYYEGREKLD